MTSVLDGAVWRTRLHPKFGENRSAGEAQALARSNRLDVGRFEHTFAPTLVDTGSALVLFDTGNGDLRDQGGAFAGLPAGRLLETLPAAGYTAEDVDLVVITHCHPDHVGGLLQDGAPAFPNAQYVFGTAEFDFWKRGEAIRPGREPTRELFMRFVAPLAPRARFIEAGQEVVPGVHAIDAAGHSPGQLAFHIESEGVRLLLWADVVIHFAMSLQRPEWHVDVDDDKDMAARTRTRILDMVATDEIWAAGYHMPFPGIGFVEKTASGYRWTPVTYQLDP